jgi:hypothetical protein
VQEREEGEITSLGRAYRADITVSQSASPAMGSEGGGFSIVSFIMLRVYYGF